MEEHKTVRNIKKNYSRSGRKLPSRSFFGGLGGGRRERILRLFSFLCHVFAVRWSSWLSGLWLTNDGHWARLPRSLRFDVYSTKSPKRLTKASDGVVFELYDALINHQVHNVQKKTSNI